MTWKCGDCGRLEERRAEGAERESVVVDAVCHHCGMPLCDWEGEGGACQHWLEDEVLGASNGLACHCRACASRHHPRVVRARRPRDLGMGRDSS